MTFRRAYVAQALCCPSRASILLGQYLHNHGVTSNAYPSGGFERFRELGHEASTIAVWLQQAGYRTILVGKYLNEYPAGLPLHVPPGWSEWRANEQHAYLAWITHEGPAARIASGFRPDSETAWAVAAIRRAETDPRPFFLYIGAIVPHEPMPVARRHQGRFAAYEPPLPPSFGELDRSDKPFAVRRLPLWADTVQARALIRQRLEALLAVDDMVAALWSALPESVQRNTYLFLTSDNGYHIGEHGLYPGKGTGYEEDIRVPLLVRGPRISGGSATSAPVLNVDLAPTIAELAGAGIPSSVDGRSLVPLLHGPAPARWREAVVIDNHFRMPAVRTGRFFFSVGRTGSLELYDLAADPYALDNVAREAPPGLVVRLRNLLDALYRCAGPQCRAVEEDWPARFEQALPPIVPLRRSGEASRSEGR
jgi:arylsulfatase A-like enzyme